MRLSVRIEHKVSDEYGRHKENDLSDVSSKHNVGVRTMIVTSVARKTWVKCLNLDKWDIVLNSSCNLPMTLFQASVCTSATLSHATGYVHISGPQQHLSVSFNMLSSFTTLSNLLAVVLRANWCNIFFVTINILATTIRIC